MLDFGRSRATGQNTVQMGFVSSKFSPISNWESKKSEFLLERHATLLYSRLVACMSQDCFRFYLWRGCKFAQKSISTAVRAFNHFSLHPIFWDKPWKLALLNSILKCSIPWNFVSGFANGLFRRTLAIRTSRIDFECGVFRKRNCSICTLTCKIGKSNWRS